MITKKMNMKLKMMMRMMTISQSKKNNLKMTKKMLPTSMRRTNSSGRSFTRD